MSGNGYYDVGQAQYLPKSVETWDDYDASSAGVDWDGWTEWQGTPDLPLTFTTTPIDFGSSQLLNYLVDLDTNFPANITVNYGDTVDSSGGSIDSPSTINVTPSASLNAVKGRYFQFTISVDRDSAGLETPYIARIDTALSAETVQRTVTDINSNTLSGSTGVRQLESIAGIGTVSSLITQVHLPSSDPYVASSYVASDYFVLGATTETPIIYIDKSTTPPTLYIYDMDAYGKRKAVDCTFDAVVLGLPALVSTALGSIEETR